MAFYTIVKKLPSGVVESPYEEGFFLSEKYVYIEGISSYSGEKVYYRHKRIKL